MTIQIDVRERFPQRFQTSRRARQGILTCTWRGHGVELNDRSDMLSKSAPPKLLQSDRFLEMGEEREKRLQDAVPQSCSTEIARGNQVFKK